MPAARNNPHDVTWRGTPATHAQIGSKTDPGTGKTTRTHYQVEDFINVNRSVNVTKINKIFILPSQCLINANYNLIPCSMRVHVVNTRAVRNVSWRSN